VVHVGVDVAVGQAVAGTPAWHDADGEGGEACECDAGQCLGEDHAAGVRHRDDDRRGVYLMWLTDTSVAWSVIIVNILIGQILLGV